MWSIERMNGSQCSWIALKLNAKTKPIMAADKIFLRSNQRINVLTTRAAELTDRATDRDWPGRWSRLTTNWMRNKRPSGVIDEYNIITRIRLMNTGLERASESCFQSCRGRQLLRTLRCTQPLNWFREIDGKGHHRLSLNTHVSSSSSSPSINGCCGCSWGTSNSSIYRRTDGQTDRRRYYRPHSFLLRARKSFPLKSKSTAVIR